MLGLFDTVEEKLFPAHAIRTPHVSLSIWRYRGYIPRQILVPRELRALGSRDRGPARATTKRHGLLLFGDVKFCAVNGFV